ncbi:MAG: polyprenyl synthetase family protein [Pirellulales bacterium]|nr:polyprenyl synthetase family protein [Pirellulales bacterium]
MSPASDYRAQAIHQINAALDRYSDFGDGCPAALREAIRYSLLAPGKRLRPQLVLLAAQACGAPMEFALPAACAVEMVHAYSLIHDDLPAMDDDAIRRGQPTCHKAFGEALAILAGDALLAGAFAVIAREIRPAQIALQCIADLSEAAGATALVGGQADDLANERAGRTGGTKCPDCKEETGSIKTLLAELESIHHRKTGAMFRVALRLGGLVAKANPTQLIALEEYGQHIGLAFQITDDLLDIAGDALAGGDQVQKESHRGKMTFPTLLGVGPSRRRAADLIGLAETALRPFGEAGKSLTALAHAILDRTQ